MSKYGFTNRMVNPVVRTILRSPLAFLLDRSLVLITVTGRRSWREHSLPVEYAQVGDVLWIFPADAERKSWWRNVVEPAPVRVILHGRRLRGTARAIEGDSEPGLVEVGLQVFLGRFPKTARRLGLVGDTGSIDEDRLRAAAKELVLVRIALRPTTT